MAGNLLNALSMHKYERLLPRIFPDATRIEIRDRQDSVFWEKRATTSDTAAEPESAKKNPVYVWAEAAPGLERRELPDGETQFRSALLSKSSGPVGWLVVVFSTKSSIPIGAATDPLRRSMNDALAFLQEEIELQVECNQLAIELTERYEELNLVYSTKDQVEYFEEGREALVRLVQNCADYLDVGMAALICRDRGLIMHHKTVDAPTDTDTLLDLLSADIYDRVESQVQGLVINDASDDDRERLFAGRSDNLIGHPILDDHGTVIGLLAVIARSETHTFSNGDRNLLEVMAKKASRIIFTHHDSLTGLMNRSGFESSMISTLAAARSKGIENCLLHIDLDQLHVINDLMGHQEGDQLIRRVAKLLRSRTRDTDYIARFGGDEFGVLLTNCSAVKGHDIADTIREAISQMSVVSAQRQLDVSASIGIVEVNAETEGIVSVMASAEIACKTAKESGRNRIQVFAEDNTTLIRRSKEVEWIGRVQQAMREDEFMLYCQPVTPISGKESSQHFELLVRLQGDDGGVLSPSVFLPAAERYQLMPMLDRWIIHNALRWLGSRWQEIGDSNPVFCINLSGQSLTNPGFLGFVNEEISQMGVPAKNVCFEITETAAISNIDEATFFMGAMRKRGCRFALDDFGAGLSSFGYLKVLPVDYLKIDGSFIRELTTDEVSRSMVDSICQIARTMGLKTVAEFVGDQETVDALAEIEVDFVQGFFIGEPEPLQDITARLQSERDAVSA